MHQQTDSAAEVSSLVKVVANGKLPLTSYDNILWIEHKSVVSQVPIQPQPTIIIFKLKKNLNNMHVYPFSWA